MKRYIKLVLSILLTVAAALAAIYFSGQSGETSQGLSRGIVQWILERVYPDYSAQMLNTMNYFLRRGAHLTLYFLLAFGLTCLFQWQKRVPPTVAAIVLGILFAATDECHQLFSQGRSAKALDVLLDACGIAIGSAAAYLVRKKRGKHELNK